MGKVNGDACQLLSPPAPLRIFQTGVLLTQTCIMHYQACHRALPLRPRSQFSKRALDPEGGLRAGLEPQRRRARRGFCPSGARAARSPPPAPGLAWDTPAPRPRSLPLPRSPNGKQGVPHAPEAKTEPPACEAQLGRSEESRGPPLTFRTRSGLPDALEPLPTPGTQAGLLAARS